MTKKIVLLILLFSSTIIQTTIELQPYERWWEHNQHIMQHMFHRPVSKFHINALSRQKMRGYIKASRYQTFLDTACGPGIEYQGFIQNNISILYQGLDITPKFVEAALSVGTPIVQASIESIPFSDNSFDVVYARHVLEHLTSYKKAITEMLRVAHHEILIIFFIRPHSGAQDQIHHAKSHDVELFHNQYSKKGIEEFIFKNSKVSSISWHYCGIDEEFLHIYLK